MPGKDVNMPASVDFGKSREGHEQPRAEPLDEAVWNAWIAKGRDRERQGAEKRIRYVKVILIAVLTAAAGFWPHLVPYAVGVRFVVVLGAVVMAINSFQEHRYAFSAVFAALAIIYNPAAPPIGFSGDWQRAFVLVSAIPFVASLLWRKKTRKQND